MQFWATIGNPLGSGRSSHRAVAPGGAMQSQRPIKAKEFITDIRSGVTDFQLVEKYNVSPRGLEALLRHLVDTGLITESELEEREQFTCSLIIQTVLESRRETRVLD